MTMSLNPAVLLLHLACVASVEVQCISQSAHSPHDSYLVSFVSLCRLRFPLCPAATERETGNGRDWGERVKPRRRRRGRGRGFWVKWATARRAMTPLMTGGTSSHRATCRDWILPPKKLPHRFCFPFYDSFFPPFSARLCFLAGARWRSTVDLWLVYIVTSYLLSILSSLTWIDRLD